MADDAKRHASNKLFVAGFFRSTSLSFSNALDLALIVRFSDDISCICSCQRQGGSGQ